MKNWILILFTLITITKSSGQGTLVYHTSFEIDTLLQCDFTYNYYQYGYDSCSLEDFYPKNFTALNTIDIYGNCDSLEIDGQMTNSFFDVPNNILGYQYPYYGQNYIGLATYNYNINFNYQYREWIGIRLPEKLVGNNYYEVSYYLSMADKSQLISQPPQIYFSNDSINYGYIINNINLNFINNNYLSVPSLDLFIDSINWVKMSVLYLAVGGEEYLYLGNFKDNNNTVYDTTGYYLPQGSNFAYFYIDDLSIYELDSTVNINENKAEKISIYPNPAQDFISIDLPKNINQAQLSIYNLTGQLIAQKQITQPNQQIPITELGNGMYIFVIQNGDKVLGRQRVVVAR